MEFAFATPGASILPRPHLAPVVCGARPRPSFASSFRSASGLPRRAQRRRLRLARSAGHEPPRASATTSGRRTVERSAEFCADGRFFRPTSVVVRDLGVLAASVLSKSLLFRPLRVLDVCSGTGVRALRYLHELPTDFVWANDAQTQASSVLFDNLEHHVHAGRARVSTKTWHEVFDDIRASTTRHQSRLPGPVDPEHPAAPGFFDLVDLDMFGACGFPEIDAALDAVNPAGGLLYLSSTDSVSASGRNPSVALRAWRAHASHHPAVNEQFLRLVIGACAQVASAKNLEIKPVFSYFHPASSTARAMIRVKAAKLPDMAQKKRTPPASEPSGLGYLGHCDKCGQNSVFPHQSETIHPTNTSFTCPACSAAQDDNDSFVVSGPLWIGRLHNADFCREMRAVAYSRHTLVDDWRPSQKVLSSLIQEAHLPPLYYTLGDVGRRIEGNTPPRDRIADELARRGFASSPTHCRPKCIKTNAPYEILLAAARTAAEDVKAMEEAARKA